MTPFQKAIKYAAMAFAVFLAVSIIGGIIGAVASVGFLFGGGSDVGEMQTYDVADGITELEIRLNASALSIEYGDFGVESNVTELSVKEKNGKLVISEPNRFGSVRAGDAVVTVYLPQGAVLKDISIEMGAGNLTAEGIFTETFSMNLGAGNVEIEELVVAKRASIDGGAGNLEIKRGGISDLDLDMGVGKLEMHVELAGESDLDLGVGDTHLHLVGSPEAYRIELDKGLGEATVDGKKASDGDVFGDGSNKIDIDSGVGKVEIDFTQAE